MKWNSLLLVILIQISIFYTKKILKQQTLTNTSSTLSNQLHDIHSLITNKTKLTFIDLALSVDNITSLSFYIHNENSFEIKEKGSDESIITIEYQKTLLTKGWDKLYVNSKDKKTNPFILAYLIGFGEGKLTYEAIGTFYHNIIHNFNKEKESSLNQLRIFYTDVLKMLNKRMLTFHEVYKTKREQDFYYKVFYFYSQLYGMYEGYNYQNNKQGKYSKITLIDFLILQADGEMPELLRWMRNKNKNYRVNIGDVDYFEKAFDISTEDPELAWREIIRQSRCSALIYLNNINNTYDVFSGHVTWADYSETYRIYKYFKIDISNINYEASFSSYPGFLSSTDDFIINKHKIMTTETTLSLLDQSLYTNITAEKYIPNYIRVNIASFMSRNIKEWIDYFSLINSGTYSSQWMVVDYKKVKELNTNRNIREMFYVIEQIPTDIILKDMSVELINNKYYSSFNRPYLNNTKKKLQMEKIKNLYGKIFTYEGAERKKLFDMLLSNRTSISLLEFKNILRYNGYKLNRENDTSSKLPSTGISSRYDLGENNRLFLTGGIDLKIVNLSLIDKMTSIVTNGPTSENNPNLKKFNWKDAEQFKVEHLGLPDVYDFPYIEMSLNNIRKISSNDVYTFQ